MFNPQRKSKLAQIYQESRTFQIHMQKMKQIQRQNSPLSAVRNESQNTHSKYLQLISHRKQVDKQRSKRKVDRQNNRIFHKLIQADERSVSNSLKKIEQKHSSHFYNQKIEIERIKKDNSMLIDRILNKTSLVPSHSQMEQDFKQNKRYSKMVRKLPSILKHEQQFKREVSMKQLNESRATNQSRQKIHSERKSTHISNPIQSLQNVLVQKQ